MKTIKPKFFLEVLLTSVIWTALLFLVGWVITAFGWFLIGLVWSQELFVPDNIKATAVAFFLIIGWALVILLFLIGWNRYDYFRPFGPFGDNSSDHPPLSKSFSKTIPCDKSKLTSLGTYLI